MRRKPLVRKLFPVYFMITFASVCVIAWYSLQALSGFYYSQVMSDLEIRTKMVRQLVEHENILSKNTSHLTELIRLLDKSSGTRITVILPSGKVIADSEYDAGKMENHSNRPEFRAAMAGTVGRSRHASPTMRVTMAYVALPIETRNKTVAVVRASLPANAIDARPVAIYDRILLAAAIIAIVAGVASFLAARLVTQPLRQIRQAAAKFADGDFNSRARLPDTEELANLAETINRMATQLDSQVRGITRQSREQNAILSSMTEAVIAIGRDDRVIILNPAAEQMLGVKLGSVLGRTIQEVVRNPAIQKFFAQSKTEGIATTQEMTLWGAGDRTVQAVGCALIGTEGDELGVLVVLNDVTEKRHLENIRTEFVANVSHELKTPITAIRGSIEAIRDEASPNSQQFIDILERNATRLGAIIDDLLVLSSIEGQEGTGGIQLAESGFRTVLENAIQSCRVRTSENRVTVSLDCDDSARALINEPLLEQAVTNLLDNATKYSPDGSVNITCYTVGNEIAISVEDTGCGILPEHLPRLFERFYRVDKARTRKVGGTGLGLAIARHIVQAHHGRIDVQSVPENGSVFTIHLPTHQS